MKLLRERPRIKTDTMTDLGTRRCRRWSLDTREPFPRARHMATLRMRPASHTATTGYLADTLDWFQLGQNNADIGSHAATGYNAEESH
jgi:hypothetical protein